MRTASYASSKASGSAGSCTMPGWWFREARFPATRHPPWLRELADDLGVDVPRADVLGTPLDTAQEARAIAALIGRAPFILVTSAYHMPRAMRLMLQAGLDPIPAPTGQRVDVPPIRGVSADADLLGVAQDRARLARVCRASRDERRAAVSPVLVTGASGFVGRTLCGSL